MPRRAGPNWRDSAPADTPARAMDGRTEFPPCNLPAASSCRLDGAVAGGRPTSRRDSKPVGEHGSPPAVPSNPNSRLGRERSPIAQGRDRMDAIVLGIDVSKDRLDVAIRPSGESFAVGRDSRGLEELIARLEPLAPSVVALEATGGDETIVAATLGSAGLSVVGVNPAQGRAF